MLTIQQTVAIKSLWHISKLNTNQTGICKNDETDSKKCKL
jgi:hypothetical protein